jgi:hypothetical protein
MKSEEELKDLSDEELMNDLHYWKVELEKMKLLVEREVDDYRAELAKKEIELIERQIEKINKELERRKVEREREKQERREES